MNAINIAGLINLLGYTIGIALYAMLLAIVLKNPIQPGSGPNSTLTGAYARLPLNGLMLATAILGMLWNVGALVAYGLRGFGLSGTEAYPLLTAVSFTALGFLPAVVVQSVLLGRLNQTETQVSHTISIAAYCLSTIAGALHFYTAVTAGASPSLWALRLLTFGYVVLLVALFLATRHQEGWKKAAWATALAVFAVSALHLSHHRGGGADAWYTELLGHHASLPLALAILYEDYRFAFADIFLKRALALLSLVALTFALYIGIVSPLMVGQNATDTRAVSVLLGLWIMTAILYPWLRHASVSFVDRVMLRRADYTKLRSDVAQLLTQSETADDTLDAVCCVLGPALSAHQISWVDIDEKEPAKDQVAPVSDEIVTLLEGSGNRSAFVFVPTAEPPYYKFNIGTLSGGRRLFSDDIAMLDSVAVMVARRIDALRVTHERCEQSLREQEINKLATEAQLRALRAQVNPHFLFNALTTIGYLIQTAPDRALETLMKLTSLLRAVLRTDGDFVTLGEELELIVSYLDIERARFEERLRTIVDVPQELLSLRVPSLLVQPLVENAIKHGITPSRFGGEVSIRARMEHSSTEANNDLEMLSVIVSDTGLGASEIEWARGRRNGVGLSSIEERLRSYGGSSASILINSTPGAGTVVELRIPLSPRNSLPVTNGSPVRSIRERRGA
jgi:two-component system LytT family sensor kinase